MTWKHAKMLAATYAAKLDLPRDLNGASVRIADYDDPETLAFLKGGTLNVHEQRLVNQAFAREIRKRGGLVTFVPLDLAEFRQWLVENNLPNTTENRAAYIATLTCPKPVFKT